jgi:hypothetical protein
MHRSIKARMESGKYPFRPCLCRSFCLRAVQCSQTRFPALVYRLNAAKVHLDTAGHHIPGHATPQVCQVAAPRRRSRRRPPAGHAAPQVTAPTISRSRRRPSAGHGADHQQVTAPTTSRSRRRPPAGHGADHQQVTAPTTSRSRRRPPAGHGAAPQATRKGWPYYIRLRCVAWRAIVYSRATPCGWPVERRGLESHRI